MLLSLCFYCLLRFAEDLLRNFEELFKEAEEGIWGE